MTRHDGEVSARFGQLRPGRASFNQRWIMKDTMTTVGVRLKPVLLKRLEEETEKRGVTRSECLRQITEESLNDENVKLLLEELRELRQLVQLLDGRWKIGLVALLADAGKASVEDAEAFVRENLS